MHGYPIFDIRSLDNPVLDFRVNLLNSLCSIWQNFVVANFWKSADIIIVIVAVINVVVVAVIKPYN